MSQDMSSEKYPTPKIKGKRSKASFDPDMGYDNFQCPSPLPTTRPKLVNRAHPTA